MKEEDQEAVPKALRYRGQDKPFHRGDEHSRAHELFPAAFLSLSLPPPRSGHLQKAPRAPQPSSHSLAPSRASSSGQRCSLTWGKLQLALTQKLISGREISFLTGPVQPSVPGHQEVC